jgi:hypothetical protein
MPGELNETSATTAPLPNSPEARTPDGTLRDASSPPTAPPTTSSDRTNAPTGTPAPAGTTPTSPTSPGGTAPSSDPTKSTDAPKPPVVPETYTFTKASDGRDLDQSLIDRATPVFKELGLDQAAAQKLVDTYNELSKREGERLDKVVNDMRAGWREDINKDPAMSGKLETIKADIGRMKDSIFSGRDGPDQRKAFEDAMNLTGAGDHPAIVRAWWRASEAYREGQHVSGAGPSKHGQAEPGVDSRPTLAGAMYPNLPH